MPVPSWGSKGKGPLQTIDTAKLTATITRMREIGSALERYKVENGAYPGNLAPVRAGMPGTPSDSWGARMTYEPYDESRAEPGFFDSYDLISPGQDGLFDTSDDLVLNNGFVRVPRPEERDEETADASDGGFVDPGPSNVGPGPVGQRALGAAREAAGRARNRTLPDE